MSTPSARFRVFPQFHHPELEGMIRSRHRLGTVAKGVFAGERVQDRLVQALAENTALNTKEVLESFEFHKRVRKRIRREQVVDLCCGHGLVGVLFALLEPTVKHVVLVDHRRPDSVAKVLSAAERVAPWVRAKITYLEASVSDALPSLPAGAGVIGVHACGTHTDSVLTAALALGGPVAVMPCCYRTVQGRGPAGIQEVLGTALAHDIRRSYRLHDAGLRVDWDAIPEAITPMNRILIGWTERAVLSERADPGRPSPEHP